MTAAALKVCRDRTGWLEGPRVDRYTPPSSPPRITELHQRARRLTREESFAQLVSEVIT